MRRLLRRERFKCWKSRSKAEEMPFTGVPPKRHSLSTQQKRWRRNAPRVSGCCCCWPYVGHMVSVEPTSIMEWGKKKTYQCCLSLPLSSIGEQLIVIDGHVHDVRGFFDEHPAGSALLRPYVGKDASKVFNGLVYNHSNAARNILRTLRIAKLAVKPKSDWNKRLIIPSPIIKNNTTLKLVYN